MGSKLDAAGAPNFTRAELDANNYSPDPLSGADGEAVFLGTAEQIRSKRMWHLNKFNLVASDKIPLNRTLKDVRKSACALKEYRVDALPVASVVVVFHNEAWSTLLRTVQSVVDRSPR